MLNLSPYLVIPAITIVINQIVKFAIYSYSHELDFKQLIRVGGFPSSHIAVITSLMFTAIAVDGIDSSVAGLTIVLGGMIIWDNLTVRVSLAKQLRKLTELSDSKDKSLDIPDRSTSSILIGGLVGLVSGIILSVSYWKDDVSWFFDAPSQTEISVQFAVFGLLLAFAELLNYFFVRGKKYKKLPTTRKLSRAFRISMSFPASIGLIITAAQQQTLGVFDARIWAYILYDWIVISSIYFWWSTYRHAKPHLVEEREHFKKAKSKTKSKAKKKSEKKKKRK